MIETLSTYDIANRLLRDNNAAWTRPGAFALAEYLQSIEEDTGEQMEFDACSIRCDFSEFPTAVEAAGEYGWTADESEYDDANEAAALSWLGDRTSVITFDSGVIIAKF